MKDSEHSNDGESNDRTHGYECDRPCMLVRGCIDGPGEVAGEW